MGTVSGSEPFRYEISGGAGPYETAAVLAAVDLLLRQEEAGRTAPPRRFVPGPWVLSGRPRPAFIPQQPSAPGPLDWLLEDQEEEES